MVYVEHGKMQRENERNRDADINHFSTDIWNDVGYSLGWEKESLALRWIIE